MRVETRRLGENGGVACRASCTSIARRLGSVAVVALLAWCVPPAVAADSGDPVEEFIAAWCGDDPDAFASILAEDFAWTWNQGGATSSADFVRSWDNIRSRYYPECSLELQDRFGEETADGLRKEAATLRFTAQHGVTGRQVNILSVMILHVRNGRLIAGWGFQDDLTALTQAGYGLSAPQQQ